MEVAVDVCMPVDPMAAFADKNVRLAHAPTNPKDFRALAIQMAQVLAPTKNLSSQAVVLTPGSAAGNHRPR